MNEIQMARLAAELNEAQLEAVTYCDGPSLVIAGAGSGKTRVLTYKIAYLLSLGLEPWRILALTFTNKAAREMNTRIAQICGGEGTRQLWSGTFHSLFARILRIEHERIGFPADFTIYDSADSRSLLKSIVKEMGLDEKTYKPAAVACRISEAKNRLITSEEYASDASVARRDSADNLGETAKIYARYQQRLRASAAMDFDDLLVRTYWLLRDNEDVRQRYKDRFAYILVDEYQDTNHAQHQILSLLTDPASRICVVGDDAQSIYGFRGADISNILQFTEQYPTARVVKLECNYRSTGCIVEAANSIIAKNRHQLPKTVYAAGDEGEKLHVFSANTDKEEATKVAANIVRLHRKGIEYSDIALLYRTNSQSRSFEEIFQGAKIPYRIYGGLSFYQRKEIKDVIAYFRLVCNPDDEEAFRRIVNYPARGIGDTTRGHLETAAAAADRSLWDVACNPEMYGLQLNRGAMGKISAFCRLIADFREQLPTLGAYDLATLIVRKSGIGADITADRSPENVARQENVDELLGSIRSYEKEAAEEEPGKHVPLNEFLSTVSLLTDTDTEDDGSPKVTLMTVHAAKGLEFDAVFVTGMEDELFPNANAKLYPREMEEERRLFYVAVTRAKRFCYLSYAATRFRFGSLQFSEISPFIGEIDSKYLDRTDRAARPSSTPWASRTLYTTGNPFAPSQSAPRRQAERPYQPRPLAAPSPSAASMRSLGTRPKENCGESVSAAAANVSAASVSICGREVRVGTRLLHDRFGAGVVTGCEGSGDSAKVRVRFAAAGEKNLLVKFARFSFPE